MIARAAVAAALATVMQLSHSSAVDLITAAGLTWSSTGNCDDRDNPNCTSFEGIRQTTIDGIITLKTASGCLVNITGGTETGHGSGGMYTHWDGWKVDISKDGCINSYIHTGFRSLGYISGWGYQYKSPAGNLYTDEGDHWDILYYNCGGCEPDPAPPPTPPDALASPSAPPPPSDAAAPPPTGTPAPPFVPTAAAPSAPTGTPMPLPAAMPPHGDPPRPQGAMPPTTGAPSPAPWATPLTGPAKKMFRFKG